MSKMTLPPVLTSYVSVCTRGKLPTGVVEDHMYAVPSKLLEHGDEKLAELDTDHCDGTAELKSKS
jgi:hypothetical protein